MLRRMASLANLSKEELVDKILHLEQKLSSFSSSKIEDQETCIKEKEIEVITDKGQKSFDFEKYPKRPVALHVAYVGWNYSGFADQKDPKIITIESKLFDALLSSKLIIDSKNCGFSRCGRTDAGVSGFGQVVGVTVRSNLSKEHLESNPFSTNDASKEELPYPLILNRVLPSDIRVLGWSPVDSNFNARFDCIYRKYKYFFLKEDLNISEMQKGALLLLGKHDFRNFCKKDKSKPNLTFEREIISASINPTAKPNVYEFEIKGTAFLYHQVRCIMGVLFLIGKNKESCTIISRLLDVQKCPTRPSYEMASEIPLVLYECGFPNLQFIYPSEKMNRIIDSFSEMWQEMELKSVMSRLFVDSCGQYATDEPVVKKRKSQSILN